LKYEQVHMYCHFWQSTTKKNYFGIAANAPTSTVYALKPNSEKAEYLAKQAIFSYKRTFTFFVFPPRSLCAICSCSRPPDELIIEGTRNEFSFVDIRPAHISLNRLFILFCGVSENLRALY